MFGFHCYVVSLGASKISDKDNGSFEVAAFIYIPLRVLRKLKFALSLTSEGYGYLRKVSLFFC